MEKIELTPQKRVIGPTTVVWNEPTPDVDITMDLKKLSFKKESLEEIYSFHVLDHLFPDETEEALKNWFNCLKPGGKLYVIVDDFEFLARSFVGGDLSLEMYNNLYAHPTQFTQETLVPVLRKIGFKDDKIVIWFVNEVADKFIKNQVELVLEATKT